jgi:hypothetical protein
MSTFYRILVPTGESPREWAHRLWDTYGFDYDLQRCGEGSVVAWPLDVTEEELSRALRQDGIEFETFDVEDVDRFFGIDP